MSSPRGLNTRTRLPSLLRLNLDLSLKTTGFHSTAGSTPNGGVDRWASRAAQTISATIPNVLQPGAFAWFEKTQVTLVKQSVWIPHEITEKDLSHRVRMCSSHLIRHNAEQLLNKLITGDEKWILYENIKRKNLTANQEHHQQQFQNKVSINEKYCFVCGGTGKVQCTTTC
ncbi:histone-lysine N-methyltransferase SETMAR [Trichonephila clavipes]|nr:histone-lysine N-methyltransferase SETMAR [Trichonephila clavipes]